MSAAGEAVTGYAGAVQMLLVGAAGLLLLAALGLGAGADASFYLLCLPAGATLLGALRRGRWRLVVTAEGLHITGPRPVTLRFDEVVEVRRERPTARDCRLARPPRAGEPAETLVLVTRDRPPLRICNLRLSSPSGYASLVARVERREPEPPPPHPWRRLGLVLAVALLVATAAVTVVLWRVDLFDGLFRR